VVDNYPLFIVWITNRPIGCICVEMFTIVTTHFVMSFLRENPLRENPLRETVKASTM